MERTATLQDLFAHHRHGAGEVSEERASLRSSPSPGLRPLQEAAEVVSRTVHSAIHTGYHRVQEAMREMGEIPMLSISRVEGGLRLGEAELLSASAAVEEFTNAVWSALTQVETRAKTRRLPFIPSALRDSRSAVESPSAHLLEHYRELLQCLSARLAQCRLTVTLCKEELALCKSETFLFSRCGVLSSEDFVSSDAAKTPNSGNISRPNAGKAERKGQGEGVRRDVNGIEGSPKLWEGGDVGSSALEGFGIVRSVSKHAKFYMDDIVKKATNTVLVAGDNVISIARTGLAQNSLEDADGDPFRGCGRNSNKNIVIKDQKHYRDVEMKEGLGVSSSSVIPRFHYTKDEEQRLKDENVLLLHRQHENSARDAKEVEASVRELSQLTLLMNDKVMQQDEQFSILVKNTEEVRHLMQRSVEELVKPTKGFWNPSRQLIALLWISTIFLLLANYLVR
ncbi:unnamed protein product [Phytomonas sp. Hart1]|nr:unnamed protein product [Phytomonas sp. Hart1]|eukprot:CCW69889.1 unnamed protein product [Phytomonas sp. isolate Hart1]